VPRRAAVVVAARKRRAFGVGGVLCALYVSRSARPPLQLPVHVQ
jgi:hypothetical protein